MYKPSVRGNYPQRQPIKPQPNAIDLSQAFGNTNSLIAELKQLKNDIIDVCNKKLVEIDAHLETEVQKIQDSTEVLRQTQKALYDYTEKVKKGDKGDPGRNADEEALAKITRQLETKIPQALNKDELTQNILSKVKEILPKQIDEKALLGKIFKTLPANKESLKIIQQSFEIDPISVIEKIMSLPEGKFKLKTSHIDGLEQTIRAFQSQLGRGYLHGGGDTVVAGTNITITTNANGQKVISASGGGGTNTWIDDEIATGSGTSFSLGNTPIAGTVHVYGQGQRLKNITDYTISGTALTMINSWNSGDILVDYMTSQASAVFVDNEVVSGSGTSFTLASSPALGSEHIYGAGQRLYSGTDYTINGAVITTVSSWNSGDLLADYVTSGISGNINNEIVGGSATIFTLAHSPTAGSVQLYGQGQRLTPTMDYTLAGSTITTINSWSATNLLADYRD